MGKILAAVLCLFLAFLPACSLLTPQQRDNVRATVIAEYEAGNLTAAQRDAALEALDRDEPVDWPGLGFAGANIALALLGAPLLVRWQRGPATQKVGLPASKVKPA